MASPYKQKPQLQQLTTQVIYEAAAPSIPNRGAIAPTQAMIICHNKQSSSSTWHWQPQRIVTMKKALVEQTRVYNSAAAPSTKAPTTALELSFP